MTERVWGVDVAFVASLMPEIDIAEDALITPARLGVMVKMATAKAEMALTDAIGLDAVNKIYRSGKRTNAYQSVQFVIYTVVAPIVVRGARSYGSDVAQLVAEAEDVLTRVRTQPAFLGYIENEEGDGSSSFDEDAATTVTSESAPRSVVSKWAPGMDF